MSKPRGVGGDVVRSKAGVGELGWRGGVGLGSELGGDGGWNGRGGGVGGLGLPCTQQVAVQCVVRVAAKHWASGLQGTV